MSKYFLTITLGGLLLTATACSKKDTDVPQQAQIVFKDLNNTLVTQNTPLSIDLDGDGQNDFRISTLLITRGIDDVLEYLAVSNVANKVLVTETGIPACKEEGVWIRATHEGSYQWDALEPAVLMSRIFPGNDPLHDLFEGTWNQQTNKYLPVQLVKQGAVYNGWIKLSFKGTAPKGIIVHNAAYNKIAGQPIKAGQQQ